MNLSKLKGVLPVLPTPFDEEGKVDISAMEKVTLFCIEAGANGLVLSQAVDKDGIHVWRLGNNTIDTKQRCLPFNVLEGRSGNEPVIKGVGQHLQPHLHQSVQDVGAVLAATV